MRKKVVFSLYLLCIVVVFALIASSFFKEKVKEIHVSAYTKPYSINSHIDVSDNIDISILVDKKNSFYTDKKQMISSSIEGENNEINLTIKDIRRENKTIDIHGDKFYVFHYFFNIDFKIKDEFDLYIKNAYLKINYLNGTTSKINIGSFSYYKYSYNSDDLMISALKVINELDNKTNFYGFQIGLRNLNENELTINRISLLDVNAYMGDIQVLDMIKDSKNILDFYENYNNIEEQNDLKININPSENKFFCVALLYMNNYDLLFPLEKAGICVEYNVNGEEKKYIFENFLFYEQNIIEYDDYIFEIHTYDNN